MSITFWRGPFLKSPSGNIEDDLEGREPLPFETVGTGEPSGGVMSNSIDGGTLGFDCLLFAALLEVPWLDPG
jgi:hypothetical protein